MIGLNKQMSIETTEKIKVKELGSQIGYGRIMHLCEELWRESLLQKDLPPGGEFTIGPCAAAMVPCGCETPAYCDWCCGTRKLTKHVKIVKDRVQGIKC